MTTLVCLWVLSAGPAAEPAPGKLETAVQAHQDGRFEAARDALLPLTTDDRLTDSERVKALEYLASSYLALKDPAGAAGILKRLLRATPGTVLDPGLFPAELIVLEQQARLELAEEVPRPRHPGRRWSWMPGVVAIGTGGVSAWCLAEAGNRYGTLTGSPSLGLLVAGQEVTLTQQGRDFQLASQVNLAIAVVAAVATTLLWLWEEAPGR